MNTPAKRRNNKKSATARKATVNNNNNSNNKQFKLIESTNGRSHVVLSDCSADYGRALVNPFTGPLACVPSSPSVLSYKFRSWVKSEITTSSTSGFGFIIGEPYSGCSNNDTCVKYSNSAYPGSSMPSNATAVGVVSSNSNSPFSTADYGSTTALAQFRVVAAGLRIRYTGTELNRGGQIVGLFDPTGSSLYNISIGGMLTEVTARKFPVIREWTTVLWKPSIVSDYNYTFVVADSDTNDWGSMAIAIQAPPGVSLSFEFEISFLYEVNGRNVRGQTPTHLDPVGLNAVTSTALTSNHFLPHQSNSEVIGPQFLERVAQEIAHANSYVASGKRLLLEGSQLVKNVFEIGSAVKPIVRLLA